ncbi:GDYXXLXY domain-containing protein [Candidatus Woesearchaeota archaeon]|nr:GDYXXLXY domain-containing protein [Candidatus Woesearchaeota archaeon]
MNQYKRLIIALVILIGIAGSFTLYLSLPLLTGKIVILKTQPVDPFDFFRGQYLTINYEISGVNLSIDAREGDTVYVSLKEGDDKIWHADKISSIKPDSGVFIRGTAKQSWQGLGVEYGIEQYFFERDAHIPRMDSVKIKVDGSGQARIVELLMNGTSLNITYRKPSLTS